MLNNRKDNHKQQQWPRQQSDKKWIPEMRMLNNRKR